MLQQQATAKEHEPRQAAAKSILFTSSITSRYQNNHVVKRIAK